MQSHLRQTTMMLGSVTVDAALIEFMLHHNPALLSGSSH
jgi:hypothetical protein